MTILKTYNSQYPKEKNLHGPVSLLSNNNEICDERLTIKFFSWQAMRGIENWLANGRSTSQADLVWPQN